ncbi:hypothetical protein HMPREF9370_0789 [Neisseria wadsworthii 9715]|uniref:Uncharacterized protein n=1 Tax=Neisseria wadsworthii 9715 TaxID=1030841 RepID=G4CNY0_9NEIS|nr:hypothetical protein HMPREF9370_0789 [Neisseria wadsworthii 9715]
MTKPYHKNNACLKLYFRRALFFADTTDKKMHTFSRMCAKSTKEK